MLRGTRRYTHGRRQDTSLCSKVVPVGCDGDRGESPEHRRLKEAIAECIERTYEWDVETEAAERDEAGKPIWRADVLATNSKASVAFEVQLSNADYELMRQRQARYKASGVRGLWFVRTKKGFPASHEVPIFPLESTERGDFVVLESRWDSPEIWRNVTGDRIELKEFIEATLNGQLKWAPFERKADTVLSAQVTGLAMSVESEPRGGWPSFRRNYAEWLPDQSVPPWARLFVAQEQLRLSILSAVQHLGAISRRGWSEALWTFDDARRVKVTTTSKGLFISDTVSDEELLTACREAAETCRGHLPSVA